MDRPCIFGLVDGQPQIQVDGVQGWVNPKFDRVGLGTPLHEAIEPQPEQTTEFSKVPGPRSFLTKLSHVAERPSIIANKLRRMLQSAEPLARMMVPSRAPVVRQSIFEGPPPPL